MKLRQRIEREIREHGPMPFSRFMELCLYDPELGYYSRHAEQFGKAGDFYTSSDVHAVFGRLLARQFEEMWRVLGSPKEIELLELGPGRGLFARDVLDWSEKKWPDFFQALHYSVEERSPELRARLQQTLSKHLSTGRAQVTVPEPVTNSAIPRISRSLPAQIPTIVFANEFFDALPVEIVGQKGELHVDIREDHLVEVWFSITPEAQAFLDRFSVQPEPQERLEVPLLAPSYMKRIAAEVTRGFVTIIDYGYTRDEQLAGHHRGTLSTFRLHSEGSNPYEAPGEQDITAHVNFTALAAAATQAGMQVQKLRTQSQWLMGIGESNQFADAFEECRLPQEQAKVALQLKHLVTPAGMGESFHVLLASRGVNPDAVSTLAGLRFG